MKVTNCGSQNKTAVDSLAQATRNAANRPKGKATDEDPTTADEVYDRIVKPLPLSERLKLAAMILNSIPPQAVVDYSEAWTEEDLRDFSAASWQYVLQQIEEDEGKAASG